MSLFIDQEDKVSILGGNLPKIDHLRQIIPSSGEAWIDLAGEGDGFLDLLKVKKTYGGIGVYLPCGAYRDLGRTEDPALFKQAHLLPADLFDLLVSRIP